MIKDKQSDSIHLDQFIKPMHCCLLLHVFSLLIFTTILTLMLHVLRLFSNRGIFKTIFNCDRHIYAKCLYILTRTRK